MIDCVYYKKNIKWLKKYTELFKTKIKVFERKNHFKLINNTSEAINNNKLHF